MAKKKTLKDISEALRIGIVIKRFILMEKIAINRLYFSKTDCRYARCNIANKIDELTERLNSL